tara:strand:- start:231 stop:380 length:150 start_codon:yes stop_codon:yes gene_type:complete
MKVELTIDEIMFMKTALENTTIKGKDSHFVSKLIIKLAKKVDTNIEESK